LFSGELVLHGTGGPQVERGLDARSKVTNL